MLIHTFIAQLDLQIKSIGMMKSLTTYRRAIQKVTFGDLLTKQAIRKEKKYIVKLLLNPVTA
jgi:hypothetical protein